MKEVADTMKDVFNDTEAVLQEKVVKSMEVFRKEVYDNTGSARATIDLARRIIQ